MRDRVIPEGGLDIGDSLDEIGAGHLHLSRHVPPHPCTPLLTSYPLPASTDPEASNGDPLAVHSNSYLKKTTSRTGSVMRHEMSRFRSCPSPIHRSPTSKSVSSSRHLYPAA